MISKSQNKALLTIAKITTKEPAWQAYADYCLDREKGLRKQVFTKLSAFIRPRKVV